MSPTARCVACGAPELSAHLPVAGGPGREGLVPSTTQFGTALANIARCRRCGHMQLEPMPDEQVLSAAYAAAESSAYVDQEAGQRATARWALERIERHVPRRGRLLDVGCWLGFLLAQARERGWQTSGIEPSTFAAAYARERLGLEVRCCDLADAPLAEAAFDAVAMGDVLEHLPDPGPALRRIAPSLRGGGVLWLTLPDAGSRVAQVLGRRWWSVLPTHVQYFTRHSVAVLLTRCDYEVLEITTAPKAFTARYYLERVGGYSPALGRVLGRAATAARVGDRIWAPDFRDRMAVIARPIAVAS